MKLPCVEILEMEPAAQRTYIAERVQESLMIVERAIEQVKPSVVYGLMSGGNDSVPATYIASLSSKFGGVVHVDTETGIKETNDFCRTVCADRGWVLHELKPSEFVDGKGVRAPISYRDLVLANGFPGPAQHGIMYQRLKERQLACFERQMGFKAKDGERVLYVSGKRADESARRKQTTRKDNIVTVDGRRVWVSAITNFSRLECKLTRQLAGIPINPVTEKIGMSGECLCGAFASPGELEYIGKFFPEKEAEIRALEAEVKAAGFPWGWGEPPPKWWNDLKRGQTFLGFDDNPSIESQHLCVSCNKRGDTNITST